MIKYTQADFDNFKVDEYGHPQPCPLRQGADKTNKTQLHAGQTAALSERLYPRRERRDRVRIYLFQICQNPAQAAVLSGAKRKAFTGAL